MNKVNGNGGDKSNLEALKAYYEALQTKLAQYKEDLKKKIVKANEDLAKVSFKYKTN